LWVRVPPPQLVERVALVVTDVLLGAEGYVDLESAATV